MKGHSQNWEKIILSILVFLAIEITKNVESMYLKNAVKINMLVCY